MLADLGLFHSVTERTDYHSKTPSPLNPFDLFEERVSRALRGLQGGIITFAAPDVLTSGGVSIVWIFFLSIIIIFVHYYYFNAACAVS